jgi:hypothetical protein
VTRAELPVDLRFYAQSHEWSLIRTEWPACLALCGDPSRDQRGSLPWLNVLVEMEDVVGVVLPLQRGQPI